MASIHLPAEPSSQTAIERDIEDAHMDACRRGEAMYIDPATGYSVMTRDFLLKRNKCCGNKCRHCPYGHINVKPKLSS